MLYTIYLYRIYSQVQLLSRERFTFGSCLAFALRHQWKYDYYERAFEIFVSFTWFAIEIGNELCVKRFYDPAAMTRPWPFAMTFHRRIMLSVKIVFYYTNSHPKNGYLLFTKLFWLRTSLRNLFFHLLLLLLLLSNEPFKSHIEFLCQWRYANTWNALNLQYNIVPRRKTITDLLKYIQVISKVVPKCGDI